MTRCKPNSHSSFVPHLNTGQMYWFATLETKEKTKKIISYAHLIKKTNFSGTTESFILENDKELNFPIVNRNCV